jgi:branched-chain amino acid transport system substrate-binding protein
MTTALMLAAALFGASACGSAVPHDEVVQAARGGGGGGTSGGGATGGVAEGTATTGDAATGTTGAGPAASGEPAGTGGSTGGTGGSGAAGNGTGGPGTTTGQQAGGGTTTGGGDGSPVTIGVVGDFSGAPGVTLKPSSTGVQVWAAAVNGKGGLAGHPVKVIVGDAQGDPSRYKQIVQDMVENKKVIAFVGNAPAQSGASGVDYLNKAKVPVVGSGDGSPYWVGSPMHFSVVGDADGLVFGNFSYAKSIGKTKVGVLACIEASSCTSWKAGARKYHSRAGVTLAYEADISITQADFTAECLNARNAGVEVLAVIADQNTLYRTARNCASQNFRPIFISPSPSDADAEKSDLPGLIGATHVFPFTGVAGNAASDEYLAALKRYAPDQPRAQYTAAGWLSGKVFEKAFLAGVGSKKPTSAGVLEGLWGIKKGERMGGLAAGLDFRRGKANGQSFCWFINVVKSGKWTSPKGMEASCTTP